jgi:predicted DCC family thiol-disulfide oxidoreductase YuxK
LSERPVTRDNCPPTTIYYDGSCPLCRREIALVKRLTGESVDLCDISSLPPGAAVAHDLTAADAMRRFHVRTADGRIVAGAEAFLSMWGSVPRLSRLRRFANRRYAVRSLDGLYTVFLRVRPTIAGVVGRYDRWRAARRSQR